MELRQALERDLVTKINTTLEPLLGADRFRAGAFIDCDLTSAETQEESFDPTKSVMSSSQKTDDVTDRASTSGIPGTASNLPRAPAPTPGSGGEVSRRTENVQYETSRIVRKTRIPQGLIKRMSLSVLVGQEVKWQGEGKSKHKVSIPPDPETLKTIRELVAGVTGFDEDRGDQLIVDSLPFENNLVSEPVVTPAPTPKSPKWMEVSSQYWQYVLLGVLGLVVVTVMLGAVKGRKKTAVESVEAQAAVTSGASKAEVPAPDSANAPALTPAEEKENESILGKIRLEAQKEPAVAANVLRAWMKE
jgi:flagellar M-ring protein FliF